MFILPFSIRRLLSCTLASSGFSFECNEVLKSARDADCFGSGMLEVKSEPSKPGVEIVEEIVLELTVLVS